MKNYSSVKTVRGKNTYRTPSSWRYRKMQRINKTKLIKISKKYAY